MSSSKDFGMEPHTDAKHRILRYYLECWFPILGNSFDKLAYIDGFAGAGIYDDDAPGSPIIALNVANGSINKHKADVHFWFIEKDPDTALSLEEQIDEIRKDLSPRLHINDILKSSFESAFPPLVSDLQDRHDRLPIFAFIDPFGYKDVKMETLINFLANPHCEIFVTFMSKFVSRFLKLDTDKDIENFNDFFGTDKWKCCNALKGRKKINCLLGVYAEKLQSHGVKHIKMFEMNDKNNYPLYSLVFATNSDKGFDIMKQAMVKTAENFSFRFSDAVDPKQTFLYPLGSTEWQKTASTQIYKHFRGKEVLIEVIKDYVMVDALYIYRSGILQYLEDADPPKIEVVPQNKKRRRGTYPDGTMIRFLP